MGSFTNLVALSMFRKHIAVGSSHNNFFSSGGVQPEEHDESVVDQATHFLSSDDGIVKYIQDDACHMSEAEQEATSSTDRLQGCLGTRMHCQSTAFCRLWLPNDDHCLTPLHSFIRKECVEAFAVSPSSLWLRPSSALRGGRTIYPDQVGIQCTFCKHRPITDRREGAVCFPKSLSTIYHSIDTWHRRHSSRCQDIPPSIQMQLSELREQSRSGVGGSKRYWEASAKSIGLANHPSGGICFFFDVDDAADHLREYAAVFSRSLSVTSSQPMVHPDDAAMIDHFLYQLFSHMEICHYSEDCMVHAKGVKRDIEVGSPGFQCKYCQGRSGYGRYFPSSVDTLVLTNSDRNIYKHITRCHSCPQSVKSRLQASFHEQKMNGRSRQPKGRRKRFFQRVWDRMHETNISVPAL